MHNNWMEWQRAADMPSNFRSRTTLQSWAHLLTMDSESRVPLTYPATTRSRGRVRAVPVISLGEQRETLRVGQVSKQCGEGGVP